MLKKISNGCVHIVQRYLPDPFIFCIILTIVVFIAAIPAAGATPLQVVGFWGTSIWSLLAFSMQMALVLVLGTAMATAPPVKRLLDKIAGVAKTPFSAIVLVTVVGTVASWLNWGFGLVVGALLAKSIAKKVKGVDYRLLIASAYSGFVVWHAGLSGSIPLTITEVTEAVTAATGGALTESIGMDRTVLSPWNLIACLIILILMPLLNAKMHPAANEVVTVDPKLLVEEEVTVRKASTPAEKLEDCKPLSWLVVIIGVVYLVQYFAAAGNPLNAVFSESAFQKTHHVNIRASDLPFYIISENNLPIDDLVIAPQQAEIKQFVPPSHIIHIIGGIPAVVHMPTVSRFICKTTVNNTLYDMMIAQRQRQLL